MQEVPTSGGTCNDEIASFYEEKNSPEELEDMHKSNNFNKGRCLEMLEWELFLFIDWLAHRVIAEALQYPQCQKDDHKNK